MKLGGAWLGVCFALMLVSEAARASSPHVVVQFSEGIPPRDADRLMASFRAQLRDVAWVDTDDSRREDAICVVVVGIHEGRGLELRFLDGRGSEIGRPRVVPPSSREIVAMEAATIVRAFASTLHEPHAESSAAAPAAPPPVGAPEAPAPEARAPAAPAAPAALTEPILPPMAEFANENPEYGIKNTNPSFEGDFRLRLRMLYTGTLYASELPWLSGVRVEALAALSGPVHVGAAYAFDPGVDVAAAQSTIRVSQQAGMAFVGIERRTGTYAYGLDAGVDFTASSRTTLSTAPSFVAGSDASHLAVGGSLRAYALLRIPSAQRLHVDCALGVDVFPRSEHFTVREPSGAETDILSPHVIRPQMGFGIGFDPW